MSPYNEACGPAAFHAAQHFPPWQKIITILFVVNLIATLETAHDKAMQRNGGVYSGLSRHAPFIADGVDIVNM